MRFFNFGKKLKSNLIEKTYSFLINPFSTANTRLNQIQRLTKELDYDSGSYQLLKIARNLSISSPALYGYLQTMESEIYGDKGFILDLNTPFEEFNLKIEAMYREWENHCDLNEEYDFRDFERFILLHYLRDGECFIHISSDELGLKLQIIPPEFVDFDYNDGEKIKKGIEFDSNNRVVAYHIKDSDKYKSSKKRILKENIIHLKRVHSSLQVRGITQLAPVMLKILQMDKYKESAITQAEIASKLSLIATSKESTDFNPNAGDMASEDKKDVAPKTIQMEDGRIITMNDNYKIEPLNINHNPNISEFMQSGNFEVSKALGVSYLTFTGDTSKANFSSLRSALLPERRLIKRLQKLITRKVHTRLYEMFIKDLALKGVLKPKDAKLALSDFIFRTQGFDWIDPAKEIPMLREQLQMGVKTFNEALGDRGIEPRQHLKDLKDSNDLFYDELIKLQQIYSPHAVPSNAQNNQDEEDDEESHKEKDND